MILAEGLKPVRRLHVHLSPDVETAQRVGGRHGRPALLRVDTAALHADGRLFWQTDSGVWLTDQVPPIHRAVEAWDRASGARAQGGIKGPGRFPARHARARVA